MIGIIPCRYQSTRFPGKPLADIGDKPMMWHVYQQAQQASELEDVYIATDDFRIEATCKQLDIKVLMTGKAHQTGTDRVAECARILDAEAVVNIQGDEPFIDPESINKVARALKQADSTVFATNGYSRIEDPAAVASPNVVKVVLSVTGLALAYSRAPIPYPLRKEPVYLRQLGLYAFRRDALEAFTSRAQGPLEQVESVEMLRFVEYGNAVQMVEVTESGIAVDTPEDLRLANQYYEDQGKAD